jgi:hypothetical protein
MKTLVIGSALLLSSWVSFAYGSQALVNGGFETGNLTGWKVATQPGSVPDFFARGGTTTPLSGSATAGPASGSFYAVSDELGSEANALYQSFIIPGPASSVVLSFSLFVNSYSSPPAVVNPIGLNYNPPPPDVANQQARVDILTAGASPFDTGSGVLQNFYLGVDSGASPHGYTNYSFNITPLVGAGGTFQLRFAEVDNLDVLNMGVDNASINFTPFTGVPEPSSIGLSALGLTGLALRRSRHGA